MYLSQCKGNRNLILNFVLELLFIFDKTSFKVWNYVNFVQLYGNCTCPDVTCPLVLGQVGLSKIYGKVDRHSIVTCPDIYLLAPDNKDKLYVLKLGEWGYSTVCHLLVSCFFVLFLLVLELAPATRTSTKFCQVIFYVDTERCVSYYLVSYNEVQGLTYNRSSESCSFFVCFLT